MSGHGGKRKGAGRKPRTFVVETISMKVPKDVADRFRAICKQEELSQARQFAKWVEQFNLEA